MENVIELAPQIAWFVQLLHEVIDEDSSEDELEENYEMVLANHRCGLRPIPRYEKQSYIERIVNNYDAQQFQKAFRVRQSTFIYILNLIAPTLVGLENTVGRKPIDPENQLLITLRILGSPESFRSATIVQGLSNASAWKAVYQVVSALYYYRNYFIRWPTEAERRATSLRIQARCGIANIVGAVDGTHIPIRAPSIDTAFYYNRKKFASIHLQVVCNDKLEFLHCFCGFPGSVHDMRVFKHSGLQDMCNEQFFGPNEFILADTAYTLQKHVITPYKAVQPLTVAEGLFNTRLSSARSMVECSIGLLKLRWRRLLDVLDMTRIDLIPFYVMACCILHNISLLNDNQFIYDIQMPQNIPINRGPLEPGRLACIEGHNKREDLKDLL